ncbi:2-succinyl-5-enolpyruvyl-6-hydroxy-3-cyclohexene-1-carboxylic-acid synthase [Neiella marina]|uniref:2-succinyl-5-enolpyruvyl-6-hydroxy-3-cyclohexene-1-carboxylate synthase n=1 Tax=Neiella holothuriorum TaxID=2870530 RepID=A0ABS7EKB5_9GAMM|nr:2-succinyl-5-enolpyruvyl-6-hydroxy-3-cyclohexene-1-carboxylic-acid synthase [Neiella holothuriorum]MBW8192221.1 2-succinyl-5-enolpyruvyl-6-hydroxy-3-cyclohexene-1-carboxylic-acid synthase [Neiella holothuriorum]
MTDQIFPTHFSHRNELWACLLIEELTRQGVEHVCLAPGSRSTPLTLAAVNHPKLQCHTHFDERGLGFMALGLAKGSDTPVAVIVTSGSAVANLYPAIVEAYQTQQPLLLLTADRPPELIDCGANQAIEQEGIFSHFVVARLNLSAPNSKLPLDKLLRQFGKTCAAVHQGPVHINCPYREPLYPDESQQDFSADLAVLTDWLSQSAAFWQAPTAPTSFELPALPGVLIAGALNKQEQAAALDLQRQLGWPLLADVQSGLRGRPNVINHPEITLTQKPSALLQARQFVLLGGRLTSKTLSNWLMSHEWQHTLQISAHPGPFDAGLLIMHRINCAVNDATLTNPPLHPLAVDVSPSLNRASQQCWLDNQDALTELNLASQLQRSLPEQSCLMLGNSLPIRLFEQRFSGHQPVMTNRGASGIDGLLATAVGLAKAKPNVPVTLVLGDLSLLHDLNSLALLGQFAGPLVVIVLNNDGGNIFDLLPVPDQATLDDYYRLRHGYQFEQAAAQFHLDYHQPTTMSEFHQCYQLGAKANKPCLIELITKPGQAAEQLKQTIQNAAASAH